MENLKKYLPYIIVAIVGLYLLKKFSSATTTKFIPQTQFKETQQIDPLNELREKAFESLVGLGIIQTQETARQVTAQRALDVDLIKSKIAQQTNLQAINLSLLERNQDRMLQEAAIDRYYSSRRTSDIVGSINTALGGLFGGSSGSIFRTPPTFPGLF